MNEQHGAPEIIGSIISSVILIGGLFCLAGTVWGWAVGARVIHGTIAGGAIGIVAGSFLGLIAGKQTTREGRRGMGYIMGATTGGTLIAIVAIGLVIGLIRSVAM